MAYQLVVVVKVSCTSLQKLFFTSLAYTKGETTRLDHSIISYGRSLALLVICTWCFRRKFSDANLMALVELSGKSLKDGQNCWFDRSLRKFELVMNWNLFGKSGEIFGISSSTLSILERVLRSNIRYAHEIRWPKYLINLRKVSLAHPS